jgi:hypothetical protein
MFPYSWHNSPSPPDPNQELPSSQQAKNDIEFLLSILPGWSLDPDPGLVQPGHTLGEELKIAYLVKEIKARWFPPPPPEAIEEGLIG